jgi:CubicO group peptidase (beta-lactamase class C family)
LNRRSFITGLCSVCSLVLLRGGCASSEQKSGLEQRVRAQMDLGVSDGLTIGAVMMVVQRDKVLALEAAGYSDLDTQRPMRTDAIFDIRSISKPITVFGARLLVDEGKFRLDDPLAKFLPEFSRVQVKGQTKPTGVPITIRQLMTHISGIAAERPPELENITRTFDHKLAQTVALVAQQSLDFTPGSKWTYSSSGISVLGQWSRSYPGSPLNALWSSVSSSLWRCGTALSSRIAPRSHPNDVYGSKRSSCKRRDGCYAPRPEISRP